MLIFKPSTENSIGVELEIQIIDRDGYDLIGLADDLMRQLKIDVFNNNIKPEITQSMIEINSSVHDTPQELLEELKEIRNFLITQTKALNIYLTGGGTHPFQMWNDRKIYPKPNYKKAANKYGYLAKMFTVFGLHIHVGCIDGDEAIYLTNTLAHYLPQFIALSASSPFCQGEDTEFASCRSNVVNSFPLSGLADPVANWQQFTDYFKTMQDLKIVERIDNFYWDIRPRPEYGTIEIRICDAPLTLERVAMLTAFAQALAHYLRSEKPFKDFRYDNFLYRYNRFQACRYGLEASFIDLETKERKNLREEILKTFNLLEPHAEILGSKDFLADLRSIVISGQTDAQWLRNLFIQGETLEKIVYLQTQLFEGRITY